MSEKEFTPEQIIESWLADLRRGSLSLYILMLIRVLEKKNLNYGYMILKEIEKRSPDGWPLAEENTLYPLLRRLAKLGLLEREKIGRKQHYFLSLKGKQILFLMKDYWYKVDSMMEDLLKEEGMLQ